MVKKKGEKEGKDRKERKRKQEKIMKTYCAGSFACASLRAKGTGCVSLAGGWLAGGCSGEGIIAEGSPPRGRETGEGERGPEFGIAAFWVSVGGICWVTSVMVGGGLALWALGEGET